MASVELQGITKSFGPAQIIKGVDLKLEHGEFIVFVGPSGCGKSTLLRLIAGLEDITSGTLKIGERVVNDLPPKDRSIAMVFQSYALFPHMTVYENVAFGLNIARAPKAEVEAKVAEAARILKLEPLLARKPAQLSGGQRQRVAIGRAIVRNPGVFLFDEPLSNLDAALRVATRAEIAKLHRDLGATMIYVTHDQVEAMTLADKIAVLEGGYLRQFGAPLELYHHPQNQFVAGFIGSPKMNFLPAEAIGASAGGVRVRSKDFGEALASVEGTGIAPGQPLTLGIRPQDMKLGAGAGVAVSGKVELVERLGHESYIEIATASGAALSGLVAGSTAAQPGQALTLSFAASDCHLFAADGTAYRRRAVAAP